VFDKPKDGRNVGFREVQRKMAKYVGEKTQAAGRSEKHNNARASRLGDLA